MKALPALAIWRARYDSSQGRSWRNSIAGGGSRQNLESDYAKMSRTPIHSQGLPGAGWSGTLIVTDFPAMEIFSIVAAGAMEQSAKASRVAARISGVVVFFMGSPGWKRGGFSVQQTESRKEAVGGVESYGLPRGLVEKATRIPLGRMCSCSCR